MLPAGSSGACSAKYSGQTSAPATMNKRTAFRILCTSSVLFAAALLLVIAVQTRCALALKEAEFSQTPGGAVLSRSAEKLFAKHILGCLLANDGCTDGEHDGAKSSFADFGRHFLQLSHEADQQVREGLKSFYLRNPNASKVVASDLGVVGLLEAACIFATWAEVAAAGSHALRHVTPSFSAISADQLQVARQAKSRQGLVTIIRSLHNTTALGESLSFVSVPRLKQSHFRTPSGIIVEQPVQHEHVLTKTLLECMDNPSSSFIPLDLLKSSKSNISVWAPQLAWVRRLVWDGLLPNDSAWLRNPGIVNVTSLVMFPSWLPADRWVVSISGISTVSVVEGSLLGLWPMSAAGAIEASGGLESPMHLEPDCLIAEIHGQRGMQATCVIWQILSAALEAATVRNITLRPGTSARIPAGYMAVVHGDVKSVQDDNVLLLTFLATHEDTSIQMEQAKADLPTELQSDWSAAMRVIQTATTRTQTQTSDLEPGQERSPNKVKGRQRRQRWKRRVQQEASTDENRLHSSPVSAVAVAHVNATSLRWSVASDREGWPVLARLAVGHRVSRVQDQQPSWPYLTNRNIPLWADVIQSDSLRLISTSGEKQVFFADNIQPDSWYGIWHIARKSRQLGYSPTPAIVLTPPRTLPGPPSSFSVAYTAEKGNMVVIDAEWGPPQDAGGCGVLAYALSCSESDKEFLASSTVLPSSHLQHRFTAFLGHASKRCFVRAITEIGMGKPASATPTEGEARNASQHQAMRVSPAVRFAVGAFDSQDWQPVTAASTTELTQSTSDVRPSASISQAIGLMLQVLCSDGVDADTVCLRQRQQLERAAVGVSVLTTQASKSTMRTSPSFGPVFRLPANATSITVLRRLMPRHISHVDVQHALLSYPLKSVIAQSIVANPIDLDVQSQLDSGRQSNAALWSGRVVLGLGSETLSPTEQILSAAAQGATALVLIDTSPHCASHAGCWRHDFMQGAGEAKAHRMPTVVVSKEQGALLLKLTSSEWLLP